MIAAVDPSRSAPAGRASRIAGGGAGSDDDAVCLPPDALHHQALGQQPAARHERGHGNDPPADQREPPGVIESAPEPNAEQEARGLVLALRHDLETLLDCRAAAARSILALRKP